LIQQLAVGLANHVSERRFTFTRPPFPPNNVPTLATIAEELHWRGIIVALVQLGIASFLLVEACLSVPAKVSKTLNVGHLHLIPASFDLANVYVRLLKLCFPLRSI
jgi:hypothetical protein